MLELDIVSAEGLPPQRPAIKFDHERRTQAAANSPPVVEDPADARGVADTGENATADDEQAFAVREQEELEVRVQIINPTSCAH